MNNQTETDSSDQGLTVLSGIFLLLEDVYPKTMQKSVDSIIEHNSGLMRETIEAINLEDFNQLLSVQQFEKLNEREKKWQAPTVSNLKRKNYLFRLLKFTEQEHLELLDLRRIRELISLKLIKTGLEKASFINFSIKEKAKNIHLSIQGNLL